MEVRNLQCPQTEFHFFLLRLERCFLHVHVVYKAIYRVRKMFMIHCEFSRDLQRWIKVSVKNALRLCCAVLVIILIWMIGYFGRLNENWTLVCDMKCHI